MLYTADLCTGVLSCAFLLLIYKSVVFRFCAVIKFTLLAVWLLLVSFKKEKNPQIFWKLIYELLEWKQKSTWIQLLYLFLVHREITGIKIFWVDAYQKHLKRQDVWKRISIKNEEEMFCYAAVLNTSCGTVHMCSNDYCKRKANE